MSRLEETTSRTSLRVCAAGHLCPELVRAPENPGVHEELIKDLVIPQDADYRQSYD